MLASQKIIFVCLWVPQRCSSHFRNCLRLAFLTVDTRVFRRTLVLRFVCSDRCLHTGQLAGTLACSQKRQRQDLQKLCPQPMVTGSRRKFRQTRQASSFWKASGISESIFLREEHQEFIPLSPRHKGTSKLDLGDDSTVELYWEQKRLVCFDTNGKLRHKEGSQELQEIFSTAKQTVSTSCPLSST